MVRFIQSVLQGFPCLYALLHTHIHRHTMLAASYQAWPSGEMVPFRVFPGHFYIFTGGDGDWTAKSGFLLYDISLCQMAATTNSGEVTREAWHSMPRFMVTLHESHRFQLSRYLRYFTALLLVIPQHRVVQCACLFGESSCFICTFIFICCFICDSNTKK